jgi:hypothetical protein
VTRAVRLGVVAAALAGVGSVALALAHVATPGDFPNDLLPDYVSARALIEGQDPYAPTFELILEHAPVEGDTYPLTRSQRNPHTPLHIAAMVPFALLGYTAARFASVLVEAAAIALAMFIVFRALGMHRRAALALGIGVLALPLVAVDIRYGQVNGVLLLLIVGAWRALARRPGVSSGLVGIAAAFRVFPALLLVPLARAHGRRAVGRALGIGALATLGAGLVMGPSSVLGFISDATSGNLGVWAHTPWNISGSALLVRALAPVHPLYQDERAVTLVVKAVVLASIGVLLWLAARTPALRTQSPFWAAMPLVILASPIAWEHYMVLLLPAAAIACARRPLDRVAWVVYGALFLRFAQVGAWLDALGVPVGGVIVQQSRFVLSFGLLVFAAALEFRRPAAAEVPAAAIARAGGRATFGMLSVARAREGSASSDGAHGLW